PRVRRVADRRAAGARRHGSGARGRHPAPARSSAGAARALSPPGRELSGDRRHAAGLAGQGQVGHPSRPGNPPPHADGVHVMTFDELERRTDAELGVRRPPMAPDTLLPRVLAAVDAWINRPWYTRAWFTWPLGWQIAS